VRRQRLPVVPRHQDGPRAAMTVEDLLLLYVVAAVGGVGALGLLAWGIGQLAGRLAHGSWPEVPAGAAFGVATRLPAHLGDPRLAWPPAVRDQLAGPVLFYGLTGGLLAVLVTVGVVAAAHTGHPDRGQPRRERDRSPSWATARQLRHLLIRDPQRDTAAGRVVLGRLGRSRRTLVAAEPRRSVMVVAPTQAGKTTRFVIPTVLRWRGPMLVTSVKTDVLRLTRAERARRGVVHVFDPTASSGLPGCKWSPLLSCATYEAAERTATWLVEAAGEARPAENTRFWESLGAKLLAPLLYAAAASGSGIQQVASWVDRREVAEVTEILEWLADPDVLDAWAASCVREDRQRDSVYATAEAILKAFASPSARAATEITDDDHLAGRVLDVEQMLRRGDTLYLVAPAHEQDRLRPLFESLVQTVLRAAQDAYAATGRPLDPPLMLMLDEAAHIAPLRQLAGYAATGAGQGIQICSVWQDLAQVQTIYGRKAATVTNGHTARVFLPGSADLATLDATARMIGDHETARTSMSTAADGHRSVSRSTADSRVAPVEYLRQLPADVAVVLYGREPPMRLRATAWYQDPTLRRMCDPDAAAAADEAARTPRRSWCTLPPLAPRVLTALRPVHRARAQSGRPQLEPEPLAHDHQARANELRTPAGQHHEPGRRHPPDLR
jgi:type IV secretion system protein VirD4